MINDALALLGNANYRNNLVRRFVMKKEINHKYAHLCSDKVPITRFLFGDDVSQSARQIEESERLKNKISTKKNTTLWQSAGGRLRGPWGRPPHMSFSSQFKLYGHGSQRYSTRGGHCQPYARPDTSSKNVRTRGSSKPPNNQ